MGCTIIYSQSGKNALLKALLLKHVAKHWSLFCSMSVVIEIASSPSCNYKKPTMSTFLVRTPSHYIRASVIICSEYNIPYRTSSSFCQRNQGFEEYLWHTQITIGMLALVSICHNIFILQNLVVPLTSRIPWKTVNCCKDMGDHNR